MPDPDEAPGSPGASSFSEALPEVAVWRLDAADGGALWTDAIGSGRTVLVVDRRTTLAAASRLVAAAPADAVALTVEPVTDTVKAVAEDRVVETVDREGLVRVRPPLVLAASVASLGPPPGEELAAWVEGLRSRGTPVVLVEPDR